MEIDLVDVFTVGMALAALIMAIIVAARQGKNIDQTTADRLAKMHEPEVLDRLEGAYQRSDAAVKQLVDVAAGLLGIIAPLTTMIKADDAAANLLKDIQTPGALPAPTPPAVSPQG